MKQILTGLLFSALLATGCAAARVPAESAKTEITLKVESESNMLTADKAQQTTVRISISAPALPAVKRPKTQGVNLAIAFDSSSSMGGDKIIHARQAARNALALLSDNDVFSLVNYNHSVEVLIPPTRINASVRQELERIIDGIQPRGTTALFGGVSLAAEQLRQMDRSGSRVQRLILLSDGRANVGPSTPAELGRLGAALVKEGITVSTVGIGNDYNEDLMVSLAQNSDGNFYFVARSSDLPEILSKELDSALSVAAQKLKLVINCPAGIKPRGILGTDCKVDGQTIELDFNQLYAGQNKVFLLQADLPASPEGSKVTLADVQLSFRAADGTPGTTASRHDVGFTRNEELVASNMNNDVRADVVLRESNIAREKALEEADRGNYKEAAAQLRQAQGVLNSSAILLGRDELRKDASNLEGEAKKLEEAQDAPERYRGVRKEIKGRNYQVQNDQMVRQ